MIHPNVWREHCASLLKREIDKRHNWCRADRVRRKPEGQHLGEGCSCQPLGHSLPRHGGSQDQAHTHSLCMRWNVIDTGLVPSTAAPCHRLHAATDLRRKRGHGTRRVAGLDAPPGGAGIGHCGTLPASRGSTNSTRVPPSPGLYVRGGHARLALRRSCCVAGSGSAPWVSFLFF